MRPKNWTSGQSFLIGALVLGSALPVGALPDPIARAANSQQGRSLLHKETVLAGGDGWSGGAHDNLSPLYHRGIAAFGRSSIVFSSATTLTRTTQGCLTFDPTEACYDVEHHNPLALSPELATAGITSIEGISVGQAVPGSPGQGVVFAAARADRPITSRAIIAYDLDMLLPVGHVIEQGGVESYAWVAVDPTSRFVVASDERARVLRVYEIARQESPLRIVLIPHSELDVRIDSDIYPEHDLRGCTFGDSLTLYCSSSAYVLDVMELRITRISLDGALGSSSGTGTAFVSASLVVPILLGGLVLPHTQPGGLAFWDQSLHVQWLSETQTVTYIFHFR